MRIQSHCSSSRSQNTMLPVSMLIFSLSALLGHSTPSSIFRYSPLIREASSCCPRS